MVSVASMPLMHIFLYTYTQSDFKDNMQLRSCKYILTDDKQSLEFEDRKGLKLHSWFPLPSRFVTQTLAYERKQEAP